MLKNEFRIIGTAISEFQQKQSGNYTILSLTLEIEGKNGATTTLNVDFFQNANLNTNVSLLGKLVAVSGYIRSFESKTERGRFYLNLMGQDFAILTTKNVPMQQQPGNIDDNGLPF